MSLIKLYYRFFPSYRHTAYPFMPFLVDIDSFEIRVCKYLESCAAGQLQDKLHPSDTWVGDEGVTFVALLLAILSCGSHFSTLPVTQRSEACRDFGKANKRRKHSRRTNTLPSETSISSLTISQLYVTTVSRCSADSNNTGKHSAEHWSI